MGGVVDEAEGGAEGGVDPEVKAVHGAKAARGVKVVHGVKVALEAKAETDAAGAEGGQRVDRGAGVTVKAKKRAVLKVAREGLDLVVTAMNDPIIKKMARKRKEVPVRSMLARTWV